MFDVDFQTTSILFFVFFFHDTQGKIKNYIRDFMGGN